MTDSTNNSFENQWQKAFDDAELTPPESVWEKIELGLTPENSPPSKPNFGNKPYYFLGGIAVGLLGLFLWFNNAKKESQIVEKEVVKSNIFAKNEPIILEKKAIKVIGGYINNGVKYKAKVVDVVGEDTNHGAETTTEVLPLSMPPQATTIEEVSIRILNDSVEMIEPLTIKNIHSNIEAPIINLPTDQTPYYVKPVIKSKKKSIFENIKISVGAGTYQR